MSHLNKGIKIHISCMYAKCKMSSLFSFELRRHLTTHYCYSPFLQSPYQVEMYGGTFGRVAIPVRALKHMQCMINIIIMTSECKLHDVYISRHVNMSNKFVECTHIYKSYWFFGHTISKHSLTKSLHKIG